MAWDRSNSGRRGNSTEQHAADRSGKKVRAVKENDSEFSTVAPRSQEKSSVAKARAKNNATRDGASHLGKGLPAAVTIGK